MNIVFGILLFIFIARCGQFDLYILSFSSSVSIFNSSKIVLFLLWPKKCVPRFSEKKFRHDWRQFFRIPLFEGSVIIYVKISLDSLQGLLPLEDSYLVTTSLGLTLHAFRAIG